MDAETGLYYFGARYYDARISRWISADPALADGKYFPKPNDYDTEHDFYWYLQQDGSKKLAGIGGVFNSVNLDGYHYAGDNPVKLIDPDGNATILSRRVGFDGVIGFLSNDIPLISPGHSVIAYRDNGKIRVIQYGPYGLKEYENNSGPYTIKSVGMDDAMTKEAVSKVIKSGEFTKEKYNWLFNNCNDFASAVFSEYKKLFIEKQMGKDKGIISRIKAEFSWWIHKSEINANKGEKINKYKEYRKFEGKK